MSDLKDYLRDKIKKGIHVSFSIDIRIVENFLKKLFGRQQKVEEKDNGHKKNRRRDI